MRRVCRRYDIQTVFWLASILCRQLTRVKDQDPLEKKLGVAYQIPCSCVYVRQTKRTHKTHVKEQKAATRWGETEKSVTAEYTWGQCQPILWEKTRVLDQAKNNTLLISTLISGWSTHEDKGVAIPECWQPVLDYAMMTNSTHTMPHQETDDGTIDAT